MSIKRNNIPKSEKGANNGVATLDGTGNVPLSQLGNVPASGTAKMMFAMDWVTASSSEADFRRAKGSADPLYPMSSPSGYVNANSDPIVISEAGTLTKISLRISKAAVSQATVGANPTIAIKVYNQTKNARTLIATERIILDPTGVGVFTTPTDCYQTASKTMSHAFSVGDQLAFSWQAETTDNEKINVVEILKITATYEF
jgi:hypothetical protein